MSECKQGMIPPPFYYTEAKKTDQHVIPRTKYYSFLH